MKLLLEKINIKYVIIFIFVLLSMIHLCKINNINNNKKELFLDIKEDQNISTDIKIKIPSLSQVEFGGSTGKNLNDIINSKADKPYVIDELNKLDTSTKAEIKTNLDSLTTLSNTKADINDGMPELSIIAYAGSNLPTGWQLCDGKVFKYNDDTTNVSPTDLRAKDMNSLSNSESKMFEILTPDLRGRFILGSNPTKKVTGATTNFDRNIRLINETGGEEKHTLTIAEMPNHNHSIPANGNRTAYGRQGTGSGPFDYVQQTGYNGSNVPHENMPPFYVLTYIIKQLKKP